MLLPKISQYLYINIHHTLSNRSTSTNGATARRQTINNAEGHIFFLLREERPTVFVLRYPIILPPGGQGMHSNEQAIERKHEIMAQKLVTSYIRLCFYGTQKGTVLFFLSKIDSKNCGGCFVECWNKGGFTFMTIWVHTQYWFRGGHYTRMKTMSQVLYKC